MAKNLQFSTKRIAIDKANTQMVITVAIASFLTVFALIAAHALWGQSAYQRRVIDKRQAAVDQLKDNIKAADELQSSYENFIDTAQNALGGDPKGDGGKDGNNAQLVLHALPQKYDFPALTSSIEKILLGNHLVIDSIGGTDDELAQQSNTTSDDPEPVEIPFSLAIRQASYDSVQDLIDTLQRSIRPLSIDTLEITGGGVNMQVTISAHTYYQPAKSLNIKTEVVK